ncbi:protein MCM10 isoform X2 [Cryptosporidium felis]|nr:protein MCM10 isoform X2 [Cryptosporidium felis]
MVESSININSRNGIFEENSGLFLETIFTPKIRISELIRDGNLFKLSEIDKLSLTPLNNNGSNYIFVVFYSSPCDNKRVSDKSGKKYSIFNVTDLKGYKCKLYIFGEANEHFKNEKTGYLYLIVNPNVTTSENNGDSYLTISKKNQIIKVGKVQGFSICRGMSRNGIPCSNPIDLNFEKEFCKYHLNSVERSKELNNCVLRNSNFINNRIQDSSILEKSKSSKLIDGEPEYIEKKLDFRRMVRTNTRLELVEKIKMNNLRPEKTGILNKENDIFELSNKLKNSTYENNKSEILSILRCLSNFDTSNTTLQNIIDSGIINVITCLELNNIDIETSIFALKVRHKLCNSKGYWPKLELVKSIVKGSSNYSNCNLREQNWSNIHKSISLLENKIPIEGKDVTVDKLLNILETDNQKYPGEKIKTKNGMVSKIDKAISLGTDYEQELQLFENKELKKRLIELEKVDKIEEHKSKITSIKIENGVKCAKCGIWTEGNPNKSCRDKHPESIIYNQTALKESWSCRSCSARVYSINNYVMPYCPNCKFDTTCNLKKRSIYNLKSEFPKTKEVKPDET